MRGYLQHSRPRLGHWPIKSHGTALGIACHWLSPFPRPNIPIILPSLYGTASFLPAIPFSLSPPLLNGEVLFQLIPVPALALRDGLVLQAQFPMVLFPFPAARGATTIASSQPTGYTLRPVAGTHFFSTASLNKGHTHPLNTGLYDPGDIPFPPHMVRWPAASPSVYQPALATPAQRNPVPQWLPEASKSLYQQGLEALTSSTTLHDANPAQWLPAYCAHTLRNFSEEHLSLLANPDTLASFGTEVADPLLNSDPAKAQEYLQGLLATDDRGFTPVLRRRPVPLTDGPPDDEYIVCLNIATLRSHLYIDHIYRKIAELATLLAGSDIPKSPAGWVRLQTLQTYDGVDVPGNLHPTTQTVVATNKFSVLSKGNLKSMSKEILESLLLRDYKAQRSGRRFQYAAYGPPPPAGGHTIKEYAVRLSPDAQLSPGPKGPRLSTVVTFVLTACWLLWH